MMTIFRNVTLLLCLATTGVAFGEDRVAPAVRSPTPEINVRQMFEDGGAIGYIIVVLSLVMLALVFEHLLTIRRQTLMPKGLSEDIQKLISQGQLKVAE